MHLLDESFQRFSCSEPTPLASEMQAPGTFSGQGASSRLHHSRLVLSFNSLTLG